MTPPTCPACGAPAEPGATICTTCGLVYASQGAQPAPQAVLPAPAPALRCPHCHHTLPLGRRGCPFCGRSLVRSAGLVPGISVGRRRYRVTGPLGRGGMGALYLAEDTFEGGRLVTLKVLARDDPEVKQLLLQEGEILGQLRHPAIPRLIGAFEDQGLVGLAIEYAPGYSLEERLTRHDPLTGAAIPGRPYERADVLRWGVGLCRLLIFLAAHPSGPYIHQDIKPANIIYDPDTGALTLIDFGVAARAAPDGGYAPAYGTVGYAPAEQHRGQSEPRSDVYALAATLYHLATDDDPSSHPFQFPEIGQIGDLGGVLSQALRHEPGERPTAEELARELEGLLRLADDMLLHAPDGAPLSGRASLLQWCSDNWLAAADWLYGSMPALVGIYWGDLELAERLRRVREQADRADGLSEAIVVLGGPALPAGPPHVACTPAVLRIRPRARERQLRRAVALHNDSRRPVSLELPRLHWASFEPQHVTIAPGQSLSVEVVIDVPKVPVLTSRRYRLTVGDPFDPVFDLRIECVLGPILLAQRMRHLLSLSILVAGLWIVSPTPAPQVTNALVAEVQRPPLPTFMPTVQATPNIDLANAARQAELQGDWRAAIWLAEDYNGPQGLPGLRERAYRAGLQAAQSGDWRTAYAAFEAARGYQDSHPRTRHARYQLGLAAEQGGNIVEARREFAMDTLYLDARQRLDNLPETSGITRLWAVPVSSLSNIDTVVVDRNDQQIYVLDQSQIVQALNISDGTRARQFITPGSLPHDVLLIRDTAGQAVQLRSYQNRITAMRLSDSTLVLDRVVQVPEGELVAASPALNLFVFVQAIDRESRITAWSPDAPDARNVWMVTGTVKSVSFDQTQTSVAALLTHGELIVHSLQTGADTTEFGIREMAPSVAAYVPNTNLLVTAGNPWVRVWDVGQNRLRWSVWTHAAPWTDAAAEQIVVSPDGQVVAVSVANTVRVWRVSDGSLLAEQETPGVIRELAFSMNGARLATVDEQSNVMLWRLDGS